MKTYISKNINFHIFYSSNKLLEIISFRISKFIKVKKSLCAHGLLQLELCLWGDIVWMFLNVGCRGIHTQFHSLQNFTADTKSLLYESNRAGSSSYLYWVRIQALECFHHKVTCLTLIYKFISTGHIHNHYCFRISHKPTTVSQIDTTTLACHKEYVQRYVVIATEVRTKCWWGKSHQNQIFYFD